jgi:hypothetical protein
MSTIIEKLKQATPAKVRTVVGPIIRPFRSDLGLNWKPVLTRDRARWKAALNAAKRGPHVLIATSTGGMDIATHVESMLAVALTLRGAQVHILLCDKFLPACMLCAAFSEAVHRQIGSKNITVHEFAQDGPSSYFCTSCFSRARKMYGALGLPVHRFSEFIASEEVLAARHQSSTVPYAEIGDFQLDGLSVGEHAIAGALRYFARGDLRDEPDGEGVLRRYFNASLLTTQVMRHLFDRYDFASVCFNHGLYVPQGLIGEVARQMQVPVVNWCPAYRKRCFIFSHHDTYHHALLAEPTANWESMVWTPQTEAEIMAYLKSRWQGTNDWIRFNENPQEELAAITRDLEMDLSRPTIVMLTNVMWDAQLHYRANAFSNMLEWVLQTLHYFAQRPDLQLIVRVHPAEITGTIPSRQPIIPEIHKVFPVLPSNIRIIPPDSPISTYVVAMQSNAAIIYGTKTGVELSSMGLPIVVAGEAWIRGKGITMDASTPEEYFRLLDRLPLTTRLDEATTQRARKYAYHFFFRRMIPLPFMEPRPGLLPYELKLSSIRELEPGHHPGLDVICDGILSQSEFIYPAEQYQAGLEYEDSFTAMKNLAG